MTVEEKNLLLTEQLVVLLRQFGEADAGSRRRIGVLLTNKLGEEELDALFLLQHEIIHSLTSDSHPYIPLHV